MLVDFQIYSIKNSPVPGKDKENVVATNFQRAVPQFLAVGSKNLLLFGYGMTLGFPTIVIPAIQGGDGRDPNHDIVLSLDQISWFSKQSIRVSGKKSIFIMRIFSFLSGSINLLCVPLGCIFSGMFTQPVGKRRAMQVRQDSISSPREHLHEITVFATARQFAHPGLMVTVLLLN